MTNMVIIPYLDELIYFFTNDGKIDVEHCNLISNCTFSVKSHSMEIIEVILITNPTDIRHHKYTEGDILYVPSMQVSEIYLADTTTLQFADSILTFHTNKLIGISYQDPKHEE